MNTHAAGDKARRASRATQAFVAWLDLFPNVIDEVPRLLVPGEEDTVDELGLGVLAEDVHLLASDERSRNLYAR